MLKVLCVQNVQTYKVRNAFLSNQRKAAEAHIEETGTTSYFPWQKQFECKKNNLATNFLSITFSEV